MSYTNFLPLLFFALAGCTALSTQNSTPDKSAGDAALSASADSEIELYRQAITALNSSQLDQAESSLKKITKTHPEFSGPWINLALIDIRKNDIGNAEKNIVKALERNPRMPQAYNVLGFVEMSKGNIKKAADNYRHAIALKEDYALAHYNLALLQDTYFQDAKAAVQHYKRYLQLTNSQDKKTADWVLELERTISKGAE